MVDGFSLAYCVRPVIMRILWTLSLFKTCMELGEFENPFIITVK